MHRTLGVAWLRLLRNRRGVSVVEYALLLVAIVLVVAVGYRALGKGTSKTADTSTAVLMGGEAPAVSPGGGNPGSNGDFQTGCDGRSCGAPGQCFVAGTQVATPSGERAIESLQVGDRVFARGESDDAVTARPVVRTFARAAPSLVDVRLVTVGGERESVRSTPEHPYWTQDRGWVRAGDLIASETLVDRAGREVRVTKVVPIAQEATVYNIEVAEDHTYFVGHAAVWVHNQCPPAGGGGGAPPSGSGAAPPSSAPTTGPVPPAPPAPGTPGWANSNWNPGPTGSGNNNFNGHFGKHQNEFPGMTASQYGAEAARITAGGPGIQSKVDPTTGKTYYYEASTGEFAVKQSNGKISTMFKPGYGKTNPAAGQNYYNKQ